MSMGRARSDISMERIGDPVEPRSRMGRRPAPSVRLASVEHDLAGAEDFTGLQDTATVGQSIGPTRPSPLHPRWMAVTVPDCSKSRPCQPSSSGNGWLRHRPVLHHERALPHE